MSSNSIKVKPGTGSDPSVATEQLAGLDHQKVKLEWGGTGTATQVERTAPLPVAEELATTSSYPSAVAQATSSTVLLSANPSRTAAVIYNDSAATLFLGFGAAATTSRPDWVEPREVAYLEGPAATKEEIRGIWASSGSGFARCRETTR